MIDNKAEQEALKRFRDAVPDYIIGECINAAIELPPMTKLIVTMESLGHIYRKGRKVEIIEGQVEVSFDFYREHIGRIDTLYGRVIHSGKDFEIKVIGYNPMVVVSEPA